ncbi:MAG: restriction endonuclease subunit S [Colwellia sp.]|nr:restriction endonuclease subunit S [Colwellia sp.]
MANKWKVTSLKELGIQLIDCDHKTPKAVENGVPYIGIPQMDKGRINFAANPRLISEEDFVKWTRKANPKYGDVILSRRCNSGETVYVPKNSKFALGQNLVLLRPEGDRIHPEYLRWAVHGHEWWNEVAKYLNPGAIFESLKCGDIPKFEIPEPPKNVQIKIAEVLSAISDKIELNQQTNQTLGHMAQTLFKSWFIDFDPVIDNVLAAGSNISDFPVALQLAAEQRKQAHQLPNFKSFPENIRALFPSDFEQSDDPKIGFSGWVPKGWEMKFLYDLGEFINGAAYKKFEPNQNREGLPIVKIAELKNGITANTGFSTVDMPKKYHLKDQDILFSWSGNPETSIDTFVWARGDAWLNQHIFKVVPNKLSNYSFLFSLLKYLKPEFTAIARDKQTTGLGHVTVKNLKELNVVMPSNELLNTFEKQLHPILERMFLNLKNTQLMEKQRDILLPKLISGQILIKTD